MLQEVKGCPAKTAISAKIAKNWRNRHAGSPAGRVQCFKVAKIDPVSPFYPTLWLKKATLQWENPQEVRKTSL